MEQPLVTNLDILHVLLVIGVEAGGVGSRIQINWSSESPIIRISFIP